MSGGLSLRRLFCGKASYYIVAALIIISWVIIGMRVRLLASDAVAEAETAVKINDSTRSIDSGLLWLINHENPLSSGFAPSNLVSHQGVRLQSPAYMAFNEMLTAMKAEGIQGLRLASAYRPYNYQSELFTAKVETFKTQGHTAEAAEELAAQILQRPGSSEHQTGLALDVTVAGDLTEDFANTAAGKWIADNSHQFGFIIRYPQAKTGITNIIYEPWHLRYVGLPHGIIMFENNLSLEEYAGFIAEAGMYIVWVEPECNREFYLVIHSYFWPETLPDGLVDISSVCPGGRGGYILTLRGVYITN